MRGAAQLSGRSASLAQVVWAHAADSRVQAVAHVLAEPRQRGWLRMTTLCDDPLLPGVGRLLAATPNVEVVRYRPGKRCTLRMRNEAGALIYAKVVRENGNRLDRIQHEAFATWRAGHLPFRVARPLAFLPGDGVSWHQGLPGVRVLPLLLSANGAGLARQIGAALSELHASPMTCAAQFGTSEQLERSARIVRSIALLAPPLAHDAEELLASLAGAPAAQRERRAPAHGSPHAEQWLVDADELALVDFDRAALAAPELDLATFLAELAYEEAPTVNEISSAFLEGYQARAPLDRRVLALYLAHKHLAKAERAARSLRHDGIERAAGCLSRARALVDSRHSPRCSRDLRSRA